MGIYVNNLYEKLVTYADSDYYGFHMPGHKRNKSVTGVELPYDIDITEIEGFDDLHHANGILKQAQERAARVFHGEETFFLINGSTVGILSAILGCTKRGDKILMARNCHKSVYHAVYMNELEPIYIYPQFYNQKTSQNSCLTDRKKNEEILYGYKEYDLNGEIESKEVYNILKRNEDFTGENKIRAIVIVSPTYDGVVSDVEEIAKIAHSYHIPLIVDEAHGAHFGFHPYFPENANKKGADVVIHSIHKTLPSLTQTALIHMNGKIVNRDRIKKYLHILQTSSPSYVLMAGIDACINLLDSEQKDIIFENYTILLKETREKLKKMKYLRLIETDNFDFSKILISVRGTKYSGRQLYKKLLEEYHLQMEMAAGSYVLAMTSAGDIEEGFERLVQALYEIDLEISEEENILCQPQFFMKEQSVSELPRLDRIYSCSEMDRMEQSDDKKVYVLPWNCSQGKISMEYAYIYPPGIPLIVPGERISQEVILLIYKYKKMGFHIEGLNKDGYIKIIDE